MGSAGRVRCRQALADDRSLFEVLNDNASVNGALRPDRLRALTDPANYLGAAPAMVDRVLEHRNQHSA